MISIYLLILAAFATRYIAWRLFMKKVALICHRYDLTYVFEDSHVTELNLKRKDPGGYIFYCEWSAYHFFYLKGPNPYDILVSFKAYRIENFYSANAIEKLRALNAVA